MSANDRDAPQLPIIQAQSRFELLAQIGDVGRIVERPYYEVTVRHPTIKGAGAPKFTLLLLIDGITSPDGTGDTWIITCRVNWTDLSSPPLLGERP